MSAAAGRLFEQGTAPTRDRRREPREEVVRHVEYAPFPRARSSERTRLGFTRDLSPSGMCLRSETAERIGSLLRVVVRGVDGRPARESIARVAWASSTADGSFWLGLALIEDKPPATVSRY